MEKLEIFFFKIRRYGEANWAQLFTTNDAVS